MTPINDFAGLQVFERIVALGSLTSAASELGLSLAVVSKRLASLEKRLGVRLLHRNTRRLALTEEGKLLYVHAARVVNELTQARDALTRQHHEISGLLKVTAPHSFGRRRLVPLLAEYSAAHPRLRILLHLSDDVMDLIAGGYDLAIRYGVMRDSGLAAQELMQNRRILCASPDYLRRRGVPRKLSELPHHDCILIGTSPTAEWRFDDGGRKRPVRVAGHVVCNDGEAAHAMALEGMGIVLKSGWDVRDDLERGRLVQVLHKHGISAAPVNAVYLPGSAELPRLKSFIRFLAERLKAPRKV